MDWEDAYQHWAELRQREKARAHDLVGRLRACLRENGPADWEWLKSALSDEDRKWLVAAIFSRGSLPKRLLPSMIRAAVYEYDISATRHFVLPCVATYGRERVKSLLVEYSKRGTEEERKGAAKALYWASPEEFMRGVLPRRGT